MILVTCIVAIIVIAITSIVQKKTVINRREDVKGAGGGDSDDVDGDDDDDDNDNDK